MSTSTNGTDDATDPEAVPLGEGLAAAYRTLASVYLDVPDEELVEALTAWGAALDQEGLPEALAEPLDVITGAEPDLDELRPAYAKIFQGMDPHNAPAPPYESVYREGRMQGKASVVVEQKYAAAGLEFDQAPYKVDHLGTELLFLAELCERDEYEAQREFLEEHLLDWVWEYHEEAVQYGPPEFYLGVFGLTETLLGLHYESLVE